MITQILKADCTDYLRVSNLCNLIFNLCNHNYIYLIDKIIIFIFGPTYISSSFALRRLIFSALFVYIAIGTGTLLIAASRQIIHMWFLIFSAMLSVILNCILIPPFGFRGSAIANAAAMLLLIALTFYSVTFKVKITLLITKFKKAVLCGLITAVVFLYSRRFPLFVSVAIGISLYTSLILMFKAADKRDLSSLREFKV